MNRLKLNLLKINEYIFFNGFNLLAVCFAERGDFIMYELAIALRETDDVDVVNQERWLMNLDDVKEFYGNNLTVLKVS